MSKFDILILTQIHNAINFFTNSDFYHGFFIHFGIDDFSLPVIIITLVSGQYFAKWVEVKLKTNGKTSNKIKNVVNDKTVLIVGGAILAMIGIML